MGDTTLQILTRLRSNVAHVPDNQLREELNRLIRHLEGEKNNEQSRRTCTCGTSLQFNTYGLAVLSSPYGERTGSVNRTYTVGCDVVKKPNPIAKSLRSPHLKKQVVKPKKGKGSYKRIKK